MSLRVVQWATGNIGSHALRSVVEHPNLDLVGVYVHSSAKSGRDAGELCGLGPIGLIATNDVDEIVSLGADCILYMPLTCNFDEVCRLLASGANIVTTRGEFHRPASLDPTVRERVEAACRKGNTSIHSTGSSPGFVSEALPFVLTSLQRKLEGLTIDEFADLSQRDSPTMIFDVMGFGKPVREFDRRRFAYGRIAFGPSLELLAETLGMPLDSVESSGEVASAARPVQIAAGVIEAGTVAAQRMTVAGIRANQPVIQFRANWYCTTDLDVAWDLRDTGWRIAVEGDAPMDVDIHFPVPLERMAAVMPGYTANRAVNTIATVCSAPAGIRTSVDLPQITATLG